MKTASEPVRAFGWDRFGLSSRLTAAGQLADVTASSRPSPPRRAERPTGRSAANMTGTTA